MPNNLLAQSALPLGQAPTGQIQAPRTQISVPNPIDITNFFRMQQGNQRNVGILQQNEALKLQQQQLDLQKYESLIRETDKMLGIGSGVFDEAYSGLSKSRGANQSTGMTGFSNLDPMRTNHQTIMRKGQGIIDATQAKADQLGKDFLSSGSKDAATRFEAVRNMQNAFTDGKRKLQGVDGYVEYSTMHKAYNDWWDKMKEAKDNGANINLEEVDRMEKRYEDWTNNPGTQETIGMKDFLLDKYVYKGADVLAKMAADAKQLGIGAEEFAEIETSGGGVLRGEQITKRSLEEITEELHGKYRNDPNAIALYNNTVKGKLDEDGKPITFRDWVSAQAAPFAPISGKEVTETSKSGVALIKPGEGVNAKDKSGGTVSKNPYESLFNDKPGNATDDMVAAIMDSLERDGFNSTEAGRYPLLIAAKENPEDIEFSYEDENGNKLTKGDPNAVRVNIIRKSGGIDDQGNVIPEEIIGSFGKRKDLDDVIGDNPPANLIHLSDGVLKEHGIEFGLKQGPSHAISSTALDALKSLPEEIRMNPDIVMTSTYRDKHTNASVGGAKGSAHRLGDGIDIRTNNKAGAEFAKWVTDTREGRDWQIDNAYVAEIHGEGDNRHIHMSPTRYLSKNESEDPRTAKVDTSKLDPKNINVETVLRAGAETDAEGEERITRYYSNKIIAGRDVPESEVNRLLANPPKGLRGEIREVNEEIRARKKNRKRAEDLIAIKQTRELGKNEREELAEINSKYPAFENEDKTTTEWVHGMLIDKIAEGNKELILEKMIESSVVNDLPVGEPTIISYKGDKNKGLSVVRTRSNGTNRYVVKELNPSTSSGGSFGMYKAVNTSESSERVLTKDEMSELLKTNLSKFDDETMSNLFNPDEVSRMLKAEGRRNAKEVESMVDQQKLGVEGIRADNDEKKKAKVSVETPGFFKN